MEGKGNGIKTVIVNMVDVAKALCRPPSCESACLESHTMMHCGWVVMHDFTMKLLLVGRGLLWGIRASVEAPTTHALHMSYSLLSLSLCALLTDTCKYFGCELGAQTQMAGGRYIVNGAHEGTKLQELLDGFIRRFVLCSECDNPETDLVSHSLI